MKKVFLGGTCYNSKWRDELIPLLQIDYFNPVVEKGKWTNECRIKEIEERKNCDFCLYVLSPISDSPYSIAETSNNNYDLPDYFEGLIDETSFMTSHLILIFILEYRS